MSSVNQLKSAFRYARLWGASPLDSKIHEFRRSFVYQIAELLEDTSNFAMTTEKCEVTKGRRGESRFSMCLAGRNKYVAAIGIPQDFLDYPVRPLGPAASDQTITKIDRSPPSKKRKSFNAAQEMPTLAPRLRRDI
ncbi:hypothetical protein KC356_g7591 [Hortaea werneckii]|nr:hypothetical protein KC356_g7591 [Hortaea werneckii]